MNSMITTKEISTTLLLVFFFSSSPLQTSFNGTKLQADFSDTFASSYRPGLIPFGLDGIRVGIYEITHNPATVDLLTCLAYSAAAEGVLDDPLPIGMGLRVQPVDPGRVVKPPTRSHMLGMMAEVLGFANSAATSLTGPTTENVASQLEKDSDGLVDIDELSVGEMRVALVIVYRRLRRSNEKHLEHKVKPGKSKPKLKEMNPNILPAARLSPTAQ
ncbi:hypothetical protein VKT23_020193 [Stygiomarasmius scandens]|uniref:EF-hand domain-containing protein n=1 Tax=Marasmiellus scandens TaxID=2682957 RepID=A0ABR1ILI3_9AGAR